MSSPLVHTQQDAEVQEVSPQTGTVSSSVTPEEGSAASKWKEGKLSCLKV